MPAASSSQHHAEQLRAGLLVKPLVELLVRLLVKLLVRTACICGWAGLGISVFMKRLAALADAARKEGLVF